MPRTTNPRRALAAAALTLCAAFAASTPAVAAPAWTQPIDIADSNITGHAQMVVAPDGTTTVLWGQLEYGPTRLRASVKPPGGVFGPPVELTSSDSVSNPSLAVDGAGTVTAAWRDSNGDFPIVRVSRRPAGGSFTPPQDISDSGTPSDEIEVDAGGTTTIVTWRQSDRTRAAIATGTGAFVTQNPLSAPGEKGDNHPQVAVAATGAAVVAWRRDDGNGYTLRASARKPGEPFAPLGDVLKTASKDDVMFDIRLAMSPTGRATMAWQRGIKSANGLFTYTLQSAARGVSGDFGPMTTMSVPGHRADSDFGLAVSADDTAALVIPGVSGVRTTVRPSGSGWSPLELVGDAVSSHDADVAFTKGEQLLAIWYEYDGTSTKMMGADGSAEGGLGAPRRISPAGAKVVVHSHHSGLATDDEGSGMAWWAREATPSPDYWLLWRMQVAAFDAVAPEFTRIAVPATARVGETLSLAAPARDRWTGATVTWDFGDGGTEEGEHLTYAYSKPGVYTVRITATDNASNARTATRTIQVLPVRGH